MDKYKPESNEETVMGKTVLCLNCGKKVTGRTDKKFCDSYCRNSYNNRKIGEFEIQLRKTNSIIRKNRTILKTSSPHGKTTLRKEYLDMQGFDFRYFTHVYKTKAGNIYRFCYDYGYMPVDDEKILIVNWQPYMKNDPSSVVVL